MVTIMLSVVISTFLFFKPPLPMQMQPHLTEPPTRPASAAQTTAAPSGTENTRASVAATDLTSAPATTTSAVQTTAIVTNPTTITIATSPPPLSPVTNPTLALASQDQAARTVLYQRIAARSLGEGSFAVPEIACTVKNRLRVSGASINSVLRAYHAQDVRPQPSHIEVVRQVFEGELPCPATWWYALSLQDTRHWKPHPDPAIVIRRNSRSQIWIFHR